MKRRIGLLFLTGLLVAGAFFFTACGANSVNFVITDTVDGRTLLQVTETGSEQSKLIIPDGVEIIGKNAFLPSILSLVEITIPDSVIKIDEAAFSGCINLEKVNFGSGSNLKIIEDSAFYGCLSLTSLILPATVTYLGTNIFNHSESLVVTLTSVVPPAEYNSFTDVRAVIVPDGKAKSYAAVWKTYNGELFEQKDVVDNKYIISENVLKVYFGRDSEITLPAGLTKIGNNSFAHNQTLLSVTIPAGVTDIEENAFYYCKKLTNINISANVKAVKKGAFYNCLRLATVNFAADSMLTEIGENAFYGCKSLIEITLHANLKYIGKYAFYNCSLTEITIPASVMYVDYWALEIYDLTIYIKGNSGRVSSWNYAWCGYENEEYNIKVIYLN